MVKVSAQEKARVDQSQRECCKFAGDWHSKTAAPSARPPKDCWQLANDTPYAFVYNGDLAAAFTT